MTEFVSHSKHVAVSVSCIRCSFVVVVVYHTCPIVVIYKSRNALPKIIGVMYSSCNDVCRCMSVAEPQAVARTVSVFGKELDSSSIEVVQVSWPPWAIALFVLLFISVLPSWWVARHDFGALARRYHWWRTRRGADEINLL